MQPTVSIIIATYNGFSYIDTCLQSVNKNSYPQKQIIVVDNGSTDNTVAKLKDKYPNITIIALRNNRGPAAARNEGIKKATGEFILFLDNDTQIESHTIQEAVRIFNTDENIGIIQCKLIFAHDPSLLDCTGEYLGNWGFLVHRTEVGQKDDNAAIPERIFAAKSAGMCIRRKILDEISGFDPDYFIYLEETDLAWRTWLHGYTAYYVPTSIVYHTSGTSSIILSKNIHDYNVKFHGCKNYILTLLKNLGCAHLLTILPIHLILWVGLAYYALARGHAHSWLWIHKAIGWNIWHLGATFKKRNMIQATRKKTDSEIFKYIQRSKPFSYFISKVMPKKTIGNSEGFFKSYEN